MSESRITAHIRAANAAGRKAMGIFATSGFPTPSATVDILKAIDAGGADFIELGMPFSDPLAEGLPIQRSSEEALAAGASMKTTLEAARSFRKSSDTPLLLMGYLNPVIRYGVSNFFEAAASSGVDGIILPDLPPSERGLVSGPAEANGIDVVHLIAPNTPETRVREVDALSSGFVYAVSITGLTGSGHGQTDAVNAYLARSRALVQRNPLLVGFGISSREDAQRLSAHTDGFIVGSAVVRAVREAYTDDQLTSAERSQRITERVRGFDDAVPASNP